MCCVCRGPRKRPEAFGDAPPKKHEKPKYQTQTGFISNCIVCFAHKRQQHKFNSNPGVLCALLFCKINAVIITASLFAKAMQFVGHCNVLQQSNAAINTALLLQEQCSYDNCIVFVQSKTMQLP
jgi:hypothetical protein